MSIIRNIPNVSVRQLDGTEMVELMGRIYQSVRWKARDEGYTVFFRHEHREEKVKYYSICDEAHLPEGIISSCVRDYSLPKAGSELFHTPLESLGSLSAMQPYRQSGYFSLKGIKNCGRW